MNTDSSQHLEALQDIRSMMKKSTRFLSLSGLSGVFAGIFALIGAAIANYHIQNIVDELANPSRFDYSIESVRQFNLDFYFFFFLDAGSVLLLSVFTAYYFSNRKAKKEGHSLFDHTAFRVLSNLMIPLIAGGIFCVALLFHGSVVYIAPVMLLFYGLALINASKYTYDDIRYLGLCEAGLGLISAFDLHNGLLYWTLGFGVLHIIYGSMMWYKYEFKKA